MKADQSSAVMTKHPAKFVGKVQMFRLTQNLSEAGFRAAAFIIFYGEKCASIGIFAFIQAAP